MSMLLENIFFGSSVSADIRPGTFFSESISSPVVIAFLHFPSGLDQTLSPSKNLTKDP